MPTMGSSRTWSAGLEGMTEIAEYYVLLHDDEPPFHPADLVGIPVKDDVKNVGVVTKVERTDRGTLTATLRIWDPATIKALDARESPIPNVSIIRRNE
jgi:hypothetical protein